MKGTRPLDNDEIRRVSTCFTGTYQVRNRGLFILGVSTGGSHQYETKSQASGNSIATSLRFGSR